MIIKSRNNKGITLVALVVTITVLMILSTITYITMFGDNGLVTITKKVKENELQSEAEGQNKIEKLQNESVHPDIGKMPGLDGTAPTGGYLEVANKTENQLVVEIKGLDESGSGIQKIEYAIITTGADDSTAVYAANVLDPKATTYTFSGLKANTSYKVFARVTNNGNNVFSCNKTDVVTNPAYVAN